MFKVSHCGVKSSGDGVFSRPVGSVGKLVWIQSLWEVGFDVVQNPPLKALHDDRSECDQTVVVEPAKWGTSLAVG